MDHEFFFRGPNRVELPSTGLTLSDTKDSGVQPALVETTICMSHTNPGTAGSLLKDAQNFQDNVFLDPTNSTLSVANGEFTLL